MSAIIGTNGTAYLLDLQASEEVQRAIQGAILLAEAYLSLEAESNGGHADSALPNLVTIGATPKGQVRPLAALFLDAQNATAYRQGMVDLLALMDDAPRLGRTW